MSNKPGLKAFGVVLFGEGISQLGSALTGFALGIWAYKQAGSVTDLAFITAAAAIPRVLLSPFAGSLVDRWDRKTVLMVGQILSFITTLIIALLYWTDSLAVWHMVALNLIGGIFGAVVIPALTASVTLIVEKEDIQRANGMAGLAMGLIQVLAPAIAGALLVTIGMDGILIIDLITFSSGIAVLVWITIPKPDSRTDQEERAKGFWAETKFGWEFVRNRPGLLWLTCFNGIIGFGVVTMGTMITPVILGFSDEQGLGLIASVGGLGMVFGSMAVIITGGAKRKIYSVLITSGIASIGLIFIPVFTTILPIAIGGFIVMAAFPLGASASQAIFQHKVPPDVQGRVFGFRSLITGMSSPIALLLVAPIADIYFEPLLLEDGTFVDYFGWLFGTGAGRGIALMNSFVGIAIFMVVILAWMTPTLRRVDIDLPDFVADNAVKNIKNFKNENKVQEIT